MPSINLIKVFGINNKIVDITIIIINDNAKIIKYFFLPFQVEKEKENKNNNKYIKKIINITIGIVTLLLQVVTTCSLLISTIWVIFIAI